jgi:pyruvate,water dikinase
MQLIKHFSEIGLDDLPSVGGKNASLGEMYATLTQKGLRIPAGFAVTAAGYWAFLDHNDLRTSLAELLGELDTKNFHNLADVGKRIRQRFEQSAFPPELREAILTAYQQLVTQVGEDKSFAVRSSAAAEDLPTASFAGQQETFLNVRGEENLIAACQRCYASLFTDRAIKYRTDHGFDHLQVALSIGVQQMVRSDRASSGVLFTLDPDSGFENVVLIAGAWGLGENVVQGTVNTDEFLVFKPLLGQAKQPVIAHRLGSKAQTMVYAETDGDKLLRPEDAIVNQPTPEEKQRQFVLTDAEIVQLAQWSHVIEEHYETHMDIEWAKDGENGQLYIVQARPETVHSQQQTSVFKQYRLQKEDEVLCSGAGLGNKIVAGKARILHSPAEIGKLHEGEILITGRTDPDWDPVLKKAAAIITDQGGRTSHAAIVAREVGAIAVVGTGNGTQTIEDGQSITVSTAQGDTGYVYAGQLDWEETTIDVADIPDTQTKVMLILAHPDEAFRLSFLPVDGVGLMRLEFIISNAIGIHPMALRKFDQIEDPEIKAEIAARTEGFADKADYFVHTLAEATAKMAAAFYPREVIVRMSDFKSNEYANLLGGKQFEPREENPMIGFRGASRYYHPLYRDAFALECQAMRIVRDEMGLTNVKLMIPFCRTVDEAEAVLATMEDSGLRRGENGLEIYLMIEIPSNALLAEDFAPHFDGFSIGSNDLTQLTLGADRDSELLSETFSPFDPAVKQLIAMTLTKAKTSGTPTGLCGQAPSDYPEYAQFLVHHGITSISFSPDAVWQGIKNIASAEQPAAASAPTNES